MAGTLRRGTARPGTAWRGMAGTAWLARRGVAWHGKVWLAWEQQREKGKRHDGDTAVPND